MSYYEGKVDHSSESFSPFPFKNFHCMVLINGMAIKSLNS
jgi:hypothetical protein